MRKFFRRVFNLILEDVKNDIKACAMVFIILLLSTIPASFIENPKTAMLVVGFIVLAVIYIIYFYKWKE